MSVSKGPSEETHAYLIVDCAASSVEGDVPHGRFFTALMKRDRGEKNRSALSVERPVVPSRTRAGALSTKRKRVERAEGLALGKRRMWKRETSLTRVRREECSALVKTNVGKREAGTLSMRRERRKRGIHHR
ncbi:hypothetical protein C1H76_7444 [Elsinoe australis]|uniref:Uncharacterized protein n=1 Tax=Elsinoe australis TaxID=40998 RepID=A0A4U7AQB3_9PEZI|nr:hypothetical protein C1H76_7444 [Elsinoe australis]